MRQIQPVTFPGKTFLHIFVYKQWAKSGSNFFMTKPSFLPRSGSGAELSCAERLWTCHGDSSLPLFPFTFRKWAERGFMCPGGQRTTFGSQFFLPTMRVPGTEIRSSLGLGLITFTHCAVSFAQRFLYIDTVWLLRTCFMAMNLDTLGTQGRGRRGQRCLLGLTSNKPNAGSHR